MDCAHFQRDAYCAGWDDANVYGTCDGSMGDGDMIEIEVDGGTDPGGVVEEVCILKPAKFYCALFTDRGQG